MTEQVYGKSYGATPAENYQRFFVPSIGAPVADDLIGIAGLQAGERVLDVACGTGVVTRLAAERVGTGGAVAGLDVNPGMLAVARSQTPPDLSIDWYEASAEAMPLPDEAFDVVFCQMGLQFVPNKQAALREMRRVLDTGGRAFVSVPGPTPPMFAIMKDALARHIDPKAAFFADLVFSMHDVDELTELMRDAGFREIDVQAKPRTLRLPAPADFLWQYIHSTPLAEAVAQAGQAKRDALERDVCVQWQEFVVDGSMSLQVGMTTATARKVLRAALIEAESAAPQAPDTREAWDRIASGYDRTNTETQMWLGNEGLLRAGVRPGMRILDIASGSGALSIPAARIGAEVVAVDQSPIMLRLLRERASWESLQIDTRVMDGHALAFDDGSFDVAGSQFGVMLFPDMPKGIREMTRVVKREGRVLVIAYGDPHRIDFLAFLVGAVQSVRPEFNGPPMDPPPLPFQLSDPERLARELTKAGLKDVNVETITESTAFRSGAGLWDWIVWSNPIVEEVLGSLALSEGERGVIRQTLDRMVRDRGGDDGSTILTNPVNIGIGTK